MRPEDGVSFAKRALITLLATVVLCSGDPVAAASADRSVVPVESFVQTHGVRLQVLDWGGMGPDLILLHGIADNPFVFADLAPGLTDRFHVIAYARRGSEGSEVKAPYDISTLTEDLRGLMDALGIRKAHLVGHSAGGDEVTEMATRYPERVERIVYLDAAYNWTGEGYRKAYDAMPRSPFARPDSATASLAAYRTYQQSMWYPTLHDMRRNEAHIRASVVIMSDGQIRDRMAPETREALYSALLGNKPRDYTAVRCPALAIYAENLFDTSNLSPVDRDALLAYERSYWAPFQEHSIEQVRRELAKVQIVRVRGMHNSFFLTGRGRVVALLRTFLTQTPAQTK